MAITKLGEHFIIYFYNDYLYVIQNIGKGCAFYTLKQYYILLL